MERFQFMQRRPLRAWGRAVRTAFALSGCVRGQSDD